MRFSFASQPFQPSNLSSEQRLVGMKVDLLFRQSAFVQTAIVVNAGIYSLVSWDVISHEFLTIWLAAVMGLSMFRISQGRRWKKVSHAQLNREAIQVWKLRYNVGVFLSGCLWGSLALTLSPSHPITHQVLTLFLLAGLSAGAVGSYSSFTFSAYLFLGPAIVPLIVRFLSFGVSHYSAMAAMAALYLLLMVRIGRNMSDHVNQALALTVERGILLAEKEISETANREKSLFLAGVSHEIRTPLASITGYTEFLLQDGETTAATKARLQVIMKHGNHLMVLVNDLLDLARIETGRMLIEKGWMSPAQQIADAVMVVEPVAKAKGLELRTTMASSLPARIYSDATRFRQILINLINNAVKFTHAGRVEIEARMEGGTFVARVSDTGVGIEPSLVARLFEPFERGKSSTVLREEGSGLGLALSRRLATSLGGNLRLVESCVGQGSVFEFNLACEASMENEGSHSVSLLPSAPSKDRSLRERKILVAEDDLDLRELIRLYLESAGASIVVCENGQEAVNCALANKFDAVLMDIQMPVMDGYVAMQTLRGEGYAQPIIALTAHASLEDEHRCAESGCSAYVSKPFQPERLVHTIAESLR
jgi:signal transduction histidine kinase